MVQFHLRRVLIFLICSESLPSLFQIIFLKVQKFAHKWDFSKCCEYIWKKNLLMIEVNLAEWSKALRSGRSLFGGVGSNPTVDIFWSYSIPSITLGRKHFSQIYQKIIYTLTNSNLLCKRTFWIIEIYEYDGVQGTFFLVPNFLVPIFGVQGTCCMSVILSRPRKFRYVRSKPSDTLNIFIRHLENFLERL